MILKRFSNFFKIFFLLLALHTFSQPPGGGGGPCDPCNEQDALCYDPDLCVIPVDNHSGVLIFIGLALLIGLVYFNSRRKKVCCQ